MPIQRESGSFKTRGLVTVNVTPGIFSWEIDKGYLCGFMAGLVRDYIRERTEQGLGRGRSPFAPYPLIERALPDENSWVEQWDTGRELDQKYGRLVWRLPNGRFVKARKKETLRSPRDVVRLRSLQDVEEAQRTVANLEVRPARPRPDARSVDVYNVGTRSDRRGTKLSNWFRAATASGSRGYGPGRPYLSLSDGEWQQIFSEVERQKDSAMAYMRNAQAAALAQEQKRIKSAQDRQERIARQKNRAADSLQRWAAMTHKSRLQALKRAGLDPSFGAMSYEEQWKALTEARGVKRRAKAAATKAAKARRGHKPSRPSNG